MAAPTNTLTTYGAVGNREELSDIIHKIAPTKRPFMANIKKGSCKSVFPEWQLSTLAAAGANKHVQGNDATANSPTTTTRRGNRTQILSKTASVSKTQEAVTSAGRESEMALQVTYKGEEVLNDLEWAMLQNLAAIEGDDSTAAQMAGMLAWMGSNVSRGSGGSSGSYSGGQGAATNGTQRTFTEALLKSVLASAFTNGASGPKLALMSAAHKQVFSGFTGIADIRKDAGSRQATIVGAADVYIGDFGEITTVPVQFGLTRDVPIIDPTYWELLYLRPLKPVPLAETGDSMRKQLVCEATLKSKNEKSSALIADLS